MDANKLDEINALVERNRAEEEAAADTADGGNTAAEAASTVKPQVQAGESAIGDYRRNARRFALMGAAGIVLGLLVLLLLRQQNNPVMILAAVVMLGGALFMVTGLSALRPDGMARAFAQVAAMQPTTAQMQDLLEALKGIRFTGLRGPVRQQILTAVKRYRGFEGYDEALADQIEQIASNARKRSVL